LNDGRHGIDVNQSRALHQRRRLRQLGDVGGDPPVFGHKGVNRRNLGQTQQFDLALRRAAMAMNQQSKADDDNRR
jgi:hypothetical protein